MTQYLPFALCAIWTLIIMLRGNSLGPTIWGLILLALIALICHWIGLPWPETSLIVVVAGLIFWLFVEGDLHIPGLS
ncbi:MAG: hypothetical protein QOE22_687 [Candidatus Parcubacteria bacterium]|nr:hypothetical protein [Candidatus Parcubacteria bacterium]